MPVKKTKPKTPAKKRPAKKKAVKNTVKKEISQAVDAIPGLIVEHASFEKTKSIKKPPAKPEPKHQVAYDYQEQMKKKSLLWFGVILLSAVIFTMWILNIKTAIFDLGFKNEPIDQGMVEQMKNDWEETKASMPVEETNEIKQALDKQTDGKDITTQVKDLLSTIFSTTPSSTESNSNTTTLPQSNTSTPILPNTTTTNAN